MSKVIVDKNDINDLPYNLQEHSGDKYVLLEDIKHWLDDAMPVSGEAVAQVMETEGTFVGMPMRSIKFFKDVPTNSYLYTTPQQAIPAGYALVPIEPESSQIDVGAIELKQAIASFNSGRSVQSAAIRVYKAMLTEAMKGGE